MPAWEDDLARQRERHLFELMDFLRIPSISALPAHKGDVQRAAEWLEARMRAAGIESVRIMPTDGHPVVYGEWLHAPGKPTLLIYGHFDVQPVDPLNLWTNPPFEPVIRDNRLYARGATDDKGNLFIPLTVVETLLRAEGKLPVNLKFLFEGQEEIGSPQLAPFIKANAGLFSCDMVVSADGGQWDEDQPAIVLGTRGLASIFIHVQGPDHDLHSGTYGGTILNPLQALARIVSSFHHPDGRIAVEGFYSEVRELTPAERSEIARVPFSEAGYLKETGAAGFFGEAGFTTHERAWARPTLEINGLYGGFQGEGLKTVLPSTADAKISCRLVPDQDPSRIADFLAAHVKKVTPPEVKVTIRRAETGALPYLIPPDHPALTAAASVLQGVYGREPFRIRMGGTIPANAMFRSLLGAYTLVFAFGLQDELQHSPNEFFRLSSFERGQKAYAMLLGRMGEPAL